MRKIIQIKLNWTAQEGYLDGCFSSESIGTRGVTEITEHRPAGEGDRFFYDVYYSNGNMQRVYNFSNVFFEKENENDTNRV